MSGAAPRRSSSPEGAPREPTPTHDSFLLAGCIIHSPVSDDGLAWLSQTLRCVPDAVEPPAGTFDDFALTIRVTTFDDIDITLKIASTILELSTITAIGLRELLVNAVEHGNLGITFDEKSDILKSGKWQEEIERRLRSEAYRDRCASVTITRRRDMFSVGILDQGTGFDWRAYIEAERAPSALLHGRGMAMAMDAGFTEIEFRGAGNEVFLTGRCNQP